MLATSLLPSTSAGPWAMIRALWEPHLWIFVSSLLLALVLTPILRTLAMRWRFYEMPDQRLRAHSQPIPYLGGVAIFVAWAVPVLALGLTLLLSPEANRVPRAAQEIMERTSAERAEELEQRALDRARQLHGPSPTAAQIVDARREVYLSPAERVWVETPRRIFWIVGTALLVFLLGLADDLWSLPAWMKIGGQVAAALALAAGGVLFSALPNRLPQDLGGIVLFPPEAWWVLGISLVVQVVLVVGATNATNLLDGLDGLCSGVTAFICLGFLTLATGLLAWDLFNPTTGTHYANASIVVIMAFALMGASLGFLPYNFNPASIFMGNAGGRFLGFLAAALMVLFAERTSAFKWFLGAMVIFGLPIFDTGLALVRRLVNRRPIFADDRGHFYDQLVDRGYSVQTTVVINYLLAIGFVVAGVGIAFLRLREGLPIYLAVFALVTVAALKLGRVRAEQQPGPRGGGPLLGSGVRKGGRK